VAARKISRRGATAVTGAHLPRSGIVPDA